jgi:putative resolvase
MRNNYKHTLTISEFAKKVGVTPLTVRRWIYKGIIKPLRTPTGRYRFTEEHIKQVLSVKTNSNKNNNSIVIYARVSTNKQKKYLQNQIELCKQYAAAKGYTVSEIITDIDSSFNFKRKGLNKLLSKVFNSEIDKVIVYSKDRLSRIAFELFENIFSRFGVEIETIDNSENLSSDYQIKDAVEELVSFIHYITSKIYGSRNYKSKKIQECVEKEITQKITN